MKKKLITSLLLIVSMTAAMLAGCSGGTQESAAPQEATEAVEDEKQEETTAAEVSQDKEAVTLTVLAGQSTTDAGIEDMIDAALAEKYPHITLEWECVDWGNDFQPKMQQYMQSGLPDIMIGKAQDVATYAPQGVLGEIAEECGIFDLNYFSRIFKKATGFTPSQFRRLPNHINSNHINKLK